MEEKIERKLDRIVQDNSMVNTIRLIWVEQKTRKEKVIFEKDISPGREVLGIRYPTNNKWQFLGHCTGFFVNRDFLFFESGKKIRQVDRRTEEITILDIFGEDNIAFDGEHIFFLDDESVLCSYHPGDAKIERHEGTVAASFYLYEGGIYYANRLDCNKVYRYDFNNKETRLLADCPAMSVSMEGSILCYTDRRDGTEHEIPLSVNP